MSAPVAISTLAAFTNSHMGGWSWLVIVAMVAMMGAMGWMMVAMMRGAGSNRHGPTQEGPVDILKARYARGELSTEEFNERLHAIGASDDQAG